MNDCPNVSKSSFEINADDTIFLSLSTTNTVFGVKLVILQSVLCIVPFT